MRIIAVCDSCGTTSTAAKTKRAAKRNAFGQGFKFDRVMRIMTCPKCYAGMGCKV